MAGPPAPTTCPACGALAVRDGVCGRCGYAEGEAHRCPHCQAVARVEVTGPASWVCAVCGGPRLPAGLLGPLATEALVEERGARARATRARLGVWAFGVLATLATLIAAATWPAALVGQLAALAFALVPALLAVRAGARVAGATRAADEAHRRALLTGAEQLATTAPSGVTAAELATRLGVDEATADGLLTELAVHDRTRVDVGNDAEVRYSVAGPSPVRIASDESAARAEGASETEAEAHAEAEAELDALASTERAPGGRAR